MQILEWNWQMLLALGIRINRKASLIFNKKSPDTSVLEFFSFLLINPSNQVLKNILYIHPYYNMALLLLLLFLIPLCLILLQSI